MKLDLYRKKRNFNKTKEPRGKVSPQDTHLFVIQKHAASHLHYDFRLELNGVLLSFAVPKGPCLDPSVKRLAIHVEDHPVEYGHFEGIIPEGQYGGGTVMLWDEGLWIPEDEDPTAAYHDGHLRFQLHAKKLKGQWNLIRFKKNENKSWFLIKGKDKYARPLHQYDITIEKPNSVLSHYNIDEIANHSQNTWDEKEIKVRKKKLRKINQITKIDLPYSSMPLKISPQLATLVEKPPKGEEWIHELKFDGYRMLAFKKGKTVKLMSRNNHDWSARFENILEAIRKLPIKNVIFDGEIVLLDKNQHPNFQLLQNALSSNQRKPFIYYIFDLLYFDEYNLMSLPLMERKNILKYFIKDSFALRYSDHIIGSGQTVFENCCKMGLEGIISKKMNSQYAEKRTKNWLKIKCHKRQEFVIAGFSPPRQSRRYFGSLYLGYFDEKDHLRFCGNVGTGFNQSSLKGIYALLQKNITNKNPFNSKPPGLTTATWVKTRFVAEVEFSGWTNEGILRHPSFKGLRTDKPASAIRRDITPVEKIKKKNSKKLKNRKFELPFRFTNPTKILYQENNISKLDVIQYYEQIHHWILPYLINRPLTLLRCPDNYKECFYQKHINKSSPTTLYGISLMEKGKMRECIYIKDYIGLMSLIQMSSLEIHPWGSTIANIEFPDIITIDLDPGPDVAWKKIVYAAKRLQDLLSTIKLKSFVKTTGGKGLHVVIPIKREYDWQQVKNFTHALVKYLVATYPADYVGEMTKSKRQGKIFIDYLRNQRGATAISAYSIRARQGAPIAVPLDWDELTNKQEDTFYTIFTLPSRLYDLKKDPWKDFFKIKQSIKPDQF